MTEEVQGVSEGAIATITIEGRTHLNLLGPDAILDLARRLEQAGENKTVRAVILSGAGNQSFSGGVDLQVMKDLTPESAEPFIRSLHRAARLLLTLPVPVVAAIRGPCLGGALELALACDVRIAAEDAIFGLPEVRVGIPSVIEASLLPRTIGLGRARHLILTGDTVTAPEALAMGMVDRLVPSAEVKESTTATARSFLGSSRKVLESQKDIVSKWLDLPEEEAAEYSIQAFVQGFRTPVPREAMSAFLEKRQPRFDR